MWGGGGGFGSASGVPDIEGVGQSGPPQDRARAGPGSGVSSAQVQGLLSARSPRAPKGKRATISEEGDIIGSHGEIVGKLDANGNLCDRNGRVILTAADILSGGVEVTIDGQKIVVKPEDLTKLVLGGGIDATSELVKQLDAAFPIPANYDFEESLPAGALKLPAGQYRGPGGPLKEMPPGFDKWWAEKIEEMRTAKAEAKAGATSKDVATKADAPGKAKKPGKPSKPGKKPGGKPGGLKKAGGSKAPRKKAAAKPASKTKKMFWDLPDTIENTIFDRSLPLGVDVGDIEAEFAKKEPAAKEAGEAAKPKVVQLITDPKRAQGMNIGLARFRKMGFDELKEAIIELDPQTLDEMSTEPLVAATPEPAEIQLVKTFLDGGGDIALADRPEQFIAAVMDVKHLKPRLEAHLYKLRYTENLKDSQKYVDFLTEAIGLVTHHEGFKRVLTTILKLGNEMNGTAVRGFRLSTLPKLADVRSSLKPVRTALQLVIDWHFAQDREALSFIEDFRFVISKVVRLERGPLEAEIKELRGGLTKVQTVAKAAEEDMADPLGANLATFLQTAAPEMQNLEETFEQSFSDFTALCILFGEKETQAKKMQPKDFFVNVSKFLVDAEKTYKDLLAKELKAQKKAALTAKRAGKAD
ncbi:MAG: hypothetical protein KVP17_001581 [Porospora cf. gigantea B]|nr:MAG: hypothetical protein KVP17_001581 [Porospora cf. gigantea B]